MDRGIRRMVAAALAAMMLVTGAGARATGRWMTNPSGGNGDDSGFLVCEYSGTVSVTFLGDCTLGGEEKSRNNRLGFARRIQENGMDFPFRFQQSIRT